MEKTVRIGVFGCRRGKTYIKALRQGKIRGARVTALCDRDPERMENCAEYCYRGRLAPARYTDAEEFFSSGKFDAVILCNYFHQHAEYAVRALRSGIHVLSETMAAATLSDAAFLCEAAEQSRAVYMMAENYPYTRGNFELRRLYREGTLGKLLFAEGEYIHPMNPKDNAEISVKDENGYYHWRKYLPVTYYSSHSLAPLIYMTGEMPKRVVAMSAADDPAHAAEYGRLKPDAVGVMLVTTDKGAVMRINGSSYMGIRGNWYRLGCVRGGAETVRGDQAQVRVGYNSWTIPEGTEQVRTYEAVWPDGAEGAENCGHGGGDWWVMKRFIDAVRGKDDPFPDVYTAAAMSAVGILGYRSILNGNIPYDIPDFRDPAAREALKDDRQSPFPPNKTF